MATQMGRDLLIKIDMTGSGGFETVAGLRASRISFNAETVDVTTLDSVGGWRELLGGAGVRSAPLRCRGPVCFAMRIRMRGRGRCFSTERSRTSKLSSLISASSKARSS